MVRVNHSDPITVGVQKSHITFFHCMVEADWVQQGSEGSLWNGLVRKGWDSGRVDKCGSFGRVKQQDYNMTCCLFLFPLYYPLTVQPSPLLAPSSHCHLLLWPPSSHWPIPYTALRLLPLTPTKLPAPSSHWPPLPSLYSPAFNLLRYNSNSVC